MQKNNRRKKLEDKDATELDWMILESFGRKMFGDNYQVERPYKKENDQNNKTFKMKTGNKIIEFALSILFVFFFSSLFAQPFFAGEATAKGIGINAGYTFSNVQMKAGLNSPITRAAAIPNMFYAAAGYKIYLSENISITPYTGIAKYHVVDFTDYEAGHNDPHEINSTALLTSLELGRDCTYPNGVRGNYYLFINHAVSNFYGAGFKIFIE